MELSELIHARRSVRAYQDRPVEAEKVKTLLELINRAPSAGNLQAYEIYQVAAPRIRAALAHAAHQPFIAQAPLILVFFANPGRSSRKYGTRGKELYALQDADRGHLCDACGTGPRTEHGLDRCVQRCRCDRRGFGAG